MITRLPNPSPLGARPGLRGMATKVQRMSSCLACPWTSNDAKTLGSLGSLRSPPYFHVPPNGVSSPNGVPRELLGIPTNHQDLSRFLSNLLVII